MNKNILLLPLCLCFSLISFSQGKNENFYSLKIKEYFKTEAIVFKENYKIDVLIKDLKKRYTPDTSDILKAENIFLNMYHLLNDQPLSSNRSQTQEIFKRYKRQFFGYVNDKNEKKVIVQLIDCSKPNKVRKILGKGWDKNFVNYFSDDPVLKIFIYNIDLDKNSLNYM